MAWVGGMVNDSGVRDCGYERQHEAWKRYNMDTNTEPGSVLSTTECCLESPLKSYTGDLLYQYSIFLASRSVWGISECWCLPSPEAVAASRPSRERIPWLCEIPALASVRPRAWVWPRSRFLYRMTVKARESAHSIFTATNQRPDFEILAGEFISPGFAVQPLIPCRKIFVNV